MATVTQAIEFIVISIDAADKAGMMKTTVRYNSSSKEYTFVRKYWLGNDNRYHTIVDGVNVSFIYDYSTCKYEFVDYEREYDTKGRKKSKTSIGYNKEAKEDDKATVSVVESIKKEAEKQNIEIPYVETEEVKHKEFDTIKACIKANVPVYLAGPAGSGKNHAVEQAANELGLEFYFTNSVQQEFKLTGFIDAGGIYHETEFYKAFKNGGVFFLDEMDASIPEVLVLLNAAIANGYFEFPNGKINANENFRVVAAGNTVGSGADEAYTGRMVLDQATLDRFVIIEFDYDINIEMHIAKGNRDLVSLVEELRGIAKRNMLRATFSYRCISQVVKLTEAGLGIEKILTISIFKGLTKDVIIQFASNINKDNSYYNAIQALAS